MLKVNIHEHNIFHNYDYNIYIKKPSQKLLQLYIMTFASNDSHTDSVPWIHSPPPPLSHTHTHTQTPIPYE